MHQNEKVVGAISTPLRGTLVLNILDQSTQGFASDHTVPTIRRVSKYSKEIWRSLYDVHVLDNLPSYLSI